MKFGYFTLSDNNYQDNRRTPNDFVQQIVAEAIYAEELGFHSAWVGEHHFSSLGVNSAPELVLCCGQFSPVNGKGHRVAKFARLNGVGKKGMRNIPELAGGLGSALR